MPLLWRCGTSTFKLLKAESCFEVKNKARTLRNNHSPEQSYFRRHRQLTLTIAV